MTTSIVLFFLGWLALSIVVGFAAGWSFRDRGDPVVRLAKRDRKKGKGGPPRDARDR